MELNAAGVLAALAAVVLAAHGVAGVAARSALAVSFAVAVYIFAAAGLPPVDALAFCVVAVLASALARPQWALLPPAGAGVLAAAWLSILTAQGLPWLPAALVAAAVVLAAVGLAASRRDFMSSDVRDEALVLVGSFALLLAVGPAALDGWRSGVALAAEPLGAAVREGEPWLGLVVAGSVVLGGAYTVWKRR